MSTRAIRTSTSQATCDICGRTLLRGERAEIYLSGGTRRSVCELCTSRALHGGWVREGEVPEFEDSSSRVDRRRSLLGRLRKGRERGPVRDPAAEAEPDGEPDLKEEPYVAPPRPEPPPRPQPRPQRAPVSTADRSPGRDGGRGSARFGLIGREPRHVRAVPTSIEHKIASAISLFNDSEHPRTVAGIARSLGLPDVSVHPSNANGSLVNVVVSWELCWYRYEVDLSDEVPTVRLAGQGYELAELSEIERQNNAVCDDRGRLGLAA